MKRRFRRTCRPSTQPHSLHLPTSLHVTPLARSELFTTSVDWKRYLPYRRPTGAAPPAASQGARIQAGTDEHSAMTSQGVTPGQKRQLVCTSQPDCKRQDTGDSEDESTIIEDDNVVNLSDLDMDEGGFRIVRHRKDRAEGIPVLITAASERADLRQVNPILLYSELETILGGAPVKSHFTAQGALLLDVETEGQANILLETKNIGGIAISARVPHSYMKNTCIVRGVPKWYSDEELLTFLRPQGVFHARRIIRRVQASSSEWESRRTNSVVLTLLQIPNARRRSTLVSPDTSLSTTWRHHHAVLSVSASDISLSTVVGNRGASAVGDLMILRRVLVKKTLCVQTAAATILLATVVVLRGQLLNEGTRCLFWVQRMQAHHRTRRRHSARQN
ncbi:hypothetical protein HPB49_006649 [Dermacentor silvarum]|uniref:Uncharacterized protein n=1 Tax=Dermacentor silvarum TaxID=543639 RepID=A0ACB8DXC1_DERSI|nr:hypothetical protein HPB49_006649 [Dermacentor silvarum]